MVEKRNYKYFLKFVIFYFPCALDKKMYILILEIRIVENSTILSLQFNSIQPKVYYFRYFFNRLRND